MKKSCWVLEFLFLMAAAFPWTAQISWADDQPQPTPTLTFDQEKQKLELERLELENEKVKLEMEKMKVEVTKTVNSSSNRDEDKKKAMEAFASDMRLKAEDLAKEDKDKDNSVVLDLTNGEMWYKGVHYKINDFKGLCEDLHWRVKEKFIKYDISGDSMFRIQYRNMYLDRYEMQKRGVFVLEAPKGEVDFTFITPETVGGSSKFTDYRNHFETPYFTFGDERKEGHFRVLRFKHTNGFFGFDDVLEVWFDDKDNFVRIKWGMLDKK